MSTRYCYLDFHVFYVSLEEKITCKKNQNININYANSYFIIDRSLHNEKYRKKIIVTVSQTDVTVSVCHTDVTVSVCHTDVTASVCHTDVTVSVCHTDVTN
jgi:hypothetical protein